jgi:ketosteroid isomerase-like protein
VAHPNETMLRDLYAKFAQGDIAGFLDGCTDSATFTVPGKAAVSGSFAKSTFMDRASGQPGGVRSGVGCEVRYPVVGLG